MAVAVQSVVHALESRMAAPKRKAREALPSGTQVIDLTSDDDRPQPPAKRQRSQPANGYSAGPRDSSAFLKQQSSAYDDLFLKERKATKPPTPLPSLKHSPFRKQPPSWSLTAQTASLNLDEPQNGEKTANGRSTGLDRKNSWSASIENPRELAKNLRQLENHEEAKSDSNGEGYASYSQKIRESSQISRLPSTSEGENQKPLSQFVLPDVSSIRFDATGSSSSQPNQHSGQGIIDRYGNGISSHLRTQRESKGLDRFQIDEPQHVGDNFSHRLGTLNHAALGNTNDTPRKQIFSHVEINNSQRSHEIPSVGLFRRDGDSREHKKAKKRLLRDLKKGGRDVANERADSIERLFGPTGFSPMYDPNAADEARLKQLLQPKAKKVRRKEIYLNWGVDPAQSISEFGQDDLEHPRKQLQDLCRASVLASGSTAAPLTFVNDVNDRKMAGEFQFVSDYVYRDNISARGRQGAFDVGCRDECGDSCSSRTCPCLRNDRLDRDTYRQREDGLIVLSDEFLAQGRLISTISEDETVPGEGRSDKSEIVECNEHCRCELDCLNRVVQRGRTLPMEIFMTMECGFGLRSSQNIIRGQFIDRYLGELITEFTLKRRENATLFNEPSYVFSLDWFKNDEKILHIDGRNFGSPVRFVNHSCNANCGIFPVMLNQSDNRIYGLAFFAIKDISAGTELTLDYSPESEPATGEIDDSMIRCKCREPNCKGWLWPKKNSRRRGL